MCKNSRDSEKEMTECWLGKFTGNLGLRKQRPSVFVCEMAPILLQLAAFSRGLPPSSSIHRGVKSQTSSVVPRLFIVCLVLVPHIVCFILMRPFYDSFCLLKTSVRFLRAYFNDL
ncbi:hypothetical protein NC652_004819 [Populus alba x Populus x berolinensis]|nr:hypothetical protein NC652_004819 [Populus alba x Populus x berolinensis]